MSDEVERARRSVGVGELDPRKAIDPALKSMVELQVRARVQAQQASTVFIATVVSLVTSSFGFAAALAWNDAIQAVITRGVKVNAFNLAYHPTQAKVVYAFIVTILAIIAVFIIRAVATRITGRDLSTVGEHFSA